MTQVGDTGVKQKGRQGQDAEGLLQRSILQSQQDVPVALCTRGIWELRSKSPGQAAMQQGQRAGSERPGVKGMVVRALWYLHSDVGAVGGGQQCHLLLTERGDVRLL